MVFFDIINYSALVSKLLLFLVNAVGVELILWIYIVNRYSRPNRAFLLVSLYLLVWVNLDFASVLSSLMVANEMVLETSLWATRAMYVSLAVFFGIFYYFGVNFPTNIPKPKKLRWRTGLGAFLWLKYAILI